MATWDYWRGKEGKGDKRGNGNILLFYFPGPAARSERRFEAQAFGDALAPMRVAVRGAAVDAAFERRHLGCDSRVAFADARAARSAPATSAARASSIDCRSDPKGRIYAGAWRIASRKAPGTGR